MSFGVKCNNCGRVYGSITKEQAIASGKSFIQYYNSLDTEKKKNYSFDGSLETYIDDYCVCFKCGSREFHKMTKEEEKSLPNLDGVTMSFIIFE